MANRPEIKAFFHEPTFTVSYLVIDPETRRAAVVDPVLDFDQKSGRTSYKSADQILQAALAASASIDLVLETHAHADHLSAAQFFKRATAAKVAIGEYIGDVQKVFKRIFNLDIAADGRDFDKLIRDGEPISLGSLTIKAMSTPGHTPACMSYIVGDTVFVGDTLFMPDYGTARADFPGGDARTLYRSIRKLLSLPPETRVFLCHDYKAPGRDHFAWETTIAEQRAANIHVHDGISEAEFVAMREARDKTLDLPQLILPSIQVNIRAGELPAAESNGLSYLKLPLNAI